MMESDGLGIQTEWSRFLGTPRVVLPGLTCQLQVPREHSTLPANPSSGVFLHTGMTIPSLLSSDLHALSILA